MNIFEYTYGYTIEKILFLFCFLKALLNAHKRFLKGLTSNLYSAEKRVRGALLQNLKLELVDDGF